MSAIEISNFVSTEYTFYDMFFAVFMGCTSLLLPLSEGYTTGVLLFPLRFL